MSLKNLLDLRKKVSPQIQIVERIIFQKRSWKKEALRTLMVAIVATTVIWGISKADSILPSNRPANPNKSFSAVGVISEVGTTTLSINEAHGSDSNSQNSYTFNTESVLKIETKNYVPLTLSDLKAGNRIIVQGEFLDGNISIKRIISFDSTPSKEVATSTTETNIATTTASTTDTTASSTLGEKIGNFVGGIVDTITGTTSTSTDNTASTTDEATTSIQVATTTDESTTTEATTTPTIVEKVIEVVKTVVDTVVDAVTPTPTEVTPPVPTPEAPAPVSDVPQTN